MPQRFDPIAKFRRWFDQARHAGIAQPEAMALATADRAGRTSVRFVLLKNSEQRGFVFYTNALSRKGRDLARNPRAAAAFYWDRIGRQVRIEGPVSKVPPEEADRYWESRPRLSRLAGLASQQSRPLADRARLVATLEQLRKKFARRKIPRPDDWAGFRIEPQTMEFWTMRAHRLHERELFVREPQGWKRVLLQP